jgi:glutamate synthase (NADPH/NADH) small chain
MIGGTLTPKERMAIPRHEMPLQDAPVRRRNFGEVALGYTLEMAQDEAQRCLQCKNTPCVNGCPVQVPINEFVLALRDGKLDEAASIIKTRNNLPAVCGRVCPQESQCESRCTLGVRGKPVAIGRLERFVADWSLEQDECAPEKAAPTGKRVAVIGSGPAGLTCAADLARQGHEVEIFEALHEAGGVLIYGIPEFRLPKSIVRKEVEYVESLGVKIHMDAVAGKLFSVDELMKDEGFDAVFMGTGAGLPVFMNIPGINALGVYSANEFLTRINLMKGYRFPDYGTPVHVGKKVAVVGAGNVAMDSARSALRMCSLAAGPKCSETPEVHVVYRRSREEVPARAEEVEHAEQEGVKFDFLTNPVEILTDNANNVIGMRCVRMQLGEPDATGRRKPEEIPGSEFVMDVDTIIMALGTRANPLTAEAAENVERSKWGNIIADPATGRTTEDGVWAGGDVVTGSATVISAMGAGKRAAADIDRYLRGELSAAA